jgi:hypothetical protein
MKRKKAMLIPKVEVFTGRILAADRIDVSLFSKSSPQPSPSPVKGEGIGFLE